MIAKRHRFVKYPKPAFRARMMRLPDHITADGHLAIYDPSKGGLPFIPVRAFWAWDVPQGCHRGGHAHRRCEQFAIAVRGMFDVRVTSIDGHGEVFRLCDPCSGLYVPALHWDTLVNFSPDAVALVFASTPYDSLDYIEDFRDFLITGNTRRKK